MIFTNSTSMNSKIKYFFMIILILIFFCVFYAQNIQILQISKKNFYKKEHNYTEYFYIFKIRNMGQYRNI